MISFFCFRQATRKMQNCVSTLQAVLSFTKDIDEQNGALIIYKDLLSKLEDSKDFEEFFLKNDNLKLKIDTLVADCADLYDRKAKLHFIGSTLQSRMKDRFFKEQTRNPEVSVQQHVTNWFVLNKNLSPLNDAQWVQAGFVSMFRI